MATELVGIELELRGAEGVQRDLDRLDRTLDELRGRKQLKLGLQEAKREILALEGELNQLRRTRDNLAQKGIKSEGITNRIKEVSNNLRDARQAANELQYALRNLAGASFMQRFKKLSTSLKHFGQNLQTLGNTLTRAGSPFRTVMQGTLLTVGNKLFSKFSEGFESGFARSDTMKKYTRLMAEYETANYTAEQSRKELDESVQGLPIALDEAVSLAQRYTLSLGDMERGTKLAIATNNAFLASMATDNQRYQGMLQMQDLLNGKKLNSREWMSLGSSMGKAINEVGKEFGYTNENMGEFRQELYAGHIATEDFLNALQKVGTGDGSLVKLAQESMDTWEAFFSRIGTASSRFVYGILTSLDEVVKIATNGKFQSLNSFLDDKVIPTIDEFAHKTQDWIKAHPQEIIDFFKQFKSINITKLAEDFAESALAFANAFGKLAGMLGDKGIGVYVKALPWLGALGRFFTILGGFIKGVSIPAGGIGAGVWTLFGKRGGGRGGIFGRIASLFGRKKDIETAKKVAETAVDTAPVVSKASSGLLTMFKNVGLIAGTITAIGGAGFIAFRSVKTMMSDLKEMIDLASEIDWNAGAVIIGGMTAFFGAFAGLGYVIGDSMALLGSPAMLNTLKGTAFIGALTTLISGVGALDMRLIKDAFKSFRDSTNYLIDGLNNINQISDITDSQGAVDKVGRAVEIFNRITEALQIERNNPITGEGSGGLKELGSKATSTIKNLSSALTSIKGAVDTIISIGTVDETAFADIGNKIGSILTDLGGIYDKIPPEFLASGGADTVANLSTSVSNFDKTFTSIKNILTKVSGLSSQIQEVSRNRTMKTLKTDLGDFFLDMGGIYKKFVGGDIGNVKSMAEKLHNISTAMGSIRNIFNKMVEIQKIKVKSNGKGNFKAIANINKLISELTVSLNDDKIGALNSQIDAFVTRITNLMDAIGNIDQEREINAKISLKGGKVQGADTVVKKMQEAQRKISDAWGRIRTNYSKTINVTLKANVDTSGAVKSINNGSNALNKLTNSVVPKVTKQDGGAVYRAKGGSIFRPRGTDKIPAMLSQGEFVQRKRAVDTFGLDFMRKVNSLDIRGAMQSLMMRGGANASIGRQSTINNTVNNNQRVTQNINTNNPQFAKIRMGRFAGAL